MKSKEQIIKELDMKTRKMNKIFRIFYAFAFLIKCIYDVSSALINLILTIAVGLLAIGIRIFLCILFIYFIFIFTGIITKESVNITQQFSLFNPILIISASLAAICISFYSLIKDDEKVNKEHLTILRESSESFFWSTLIYVVAIIFGLLHNFVDVINIFFIPQNIIKSLVVWGFVLFIAIATFHLVFGLYNIVINVGSFYKPPSENLFSREWQKFKEAFRKD